MYEFDGSLIPRVNQRGESNGTRLVSDSSRVPFALPAVNQYYTWEMRINIDEITVGPPPAGTQPFAVGTPVAAALSNKTGTNALTTNVTAGAGFEANNTVTITANTVNEKPTPTNMLQVGYVQTVISTSVVGTYQDGRTLTSSLNSSISNTPDRESASTPGWALNNREVYFQSNQNAQTVSGGIGFFDIPSLPVPVTYEQHAVVQANDDLLVAQTVVITFELDICVRILNPAQPNSAAGVYGQFTKLASLVWICNLSGTTDWANQFAWTGVNAGITSPGGGPFQWTSVTSGETATTSGTIANQLIQTQTFG